MLYVKKGTRYLLGIVLSYTFSTDREEHLRLMRGYRDNLYTPEGEPELREETLERLKALGYLL